MRKLTYRQIYNEIINGPDNISLIRSLLSQLNDYRGLLGTLNKVSEKKRMIIYDYYIEFLLPKLGIEPLSRVKENDDFMKITLFRACVKQNKPLFQTYEILRATKNPKEYLTDNEVNWIINTYGPDVILDDFGVCFIEKLLDYTAYYFLIIRKYQDDDIVLNIVFDKLIDHDNIAEYQKVYTDLKQVGLVKLMKKFTKRFIIRKSTNAFIAYDIIKTGCHSRRDFNYLEKVVIDSNNAMLIYGLLMNDKLKWRSEKFLTALLKTNDTEYVTYYYFFKEPDKFKQIYGNESCFLAYVYLNSELFHNKYILNHVIRKIIVNHCTFTDNTKKDLKEIRKQILKLSNH